MKRSTSLLSPRFEDNKKSWIPQSRSTIKTINKITDIIKNDDSAQISHKNCPLCGSNVSTIISQKDRYGLPLDTQICSQCGLVYSSKYFSPKFAADFYNKYSIAFKTINKTPDELFLQRTHQTAYCWSRFNYVKNTLGDNFDKINSVVEIGCCDGANLFPFFKNGKNVQGCDFDEQRLIEGRRAGLKLFSGDYSTLLKNGVKADLIILSHVVEHFGELFNPIKQLKEILSPGGYIYIEVPGLKGCNRKTSQFINIDGYPSSNDLLPYLQLEHNYCFDLTTLKATVEKCGYEMISGDEIVRSIFISKNNECDSEKSIINFKNRGAEVYNYLMDVESDYCSENPWYKRKLRSLYYWLKLHLKNK
ncbi:hypothetical protein TW85_13010 [Marinomonas sp. S3726]|uniref:class I SAM-dependent methyltransferase n=1 Tax=Marinomonas sp. S3726 TaxID=579484 RepID=UPI0005F9BFAE|nr:methyltransferase domain-containing protein [Marinomonas sp. S3726]KJZ13614.1 hypothetical protein TW85_13010 [Marinomonas sp. S3726]